nr:ribonuclease H-like domain-containing protein [Tanacetum cinerariifolium]
MAKSSSKNEVFDNSLCSKDCKKNNDSLNSKITDMTDKLFDAKNMIYHYKLALAQVESRLVEYKEREVKYIEKIRTLEFYNEDRANCIEILKKKLETLKLEKDGVDGYSVVPPPPAQLYLSPKKDLSWTGLPECADDIVTDYSRPSPTVESTSGDDQNKNSSASENGESTYSILSKPAVKFVKAADRSTINKVEAVKKHSIKYAEMYRRTTKKPNKKEKKGTSRSHNKTHESFTPRPVAHRPYRHSQRPVRTNMNGARPNRTTFNKQADSYANRPFQRTLAVRPQYRAPWVPTVNRNFPPVNRKLPTGNSNISTVCCCCSRHVNTARPKAVINRRNWGMNFIQSYGYIDLMAILIQLPYMLHLEGKLFETCGCLFLVCRDDIFSSEFTIYEMMIGCSVWMVSSQNHIDDKAYWDSGCSRHMTCNISYLSDYELFNGGYVSFGQGGCKITRKGTIKTGKLEFENVYFVKDLKRLGHLNFKTMNKLVRHNLVRGLPTKCFENDHNCTACLKVKQDKASSRTMLADAKLPVTSWAEVVNTACYVQNRILVNKSHNKTLYELFNGRSPATGFLKPFGCHVMILNTLDNLGKFEANRDEGYFIGYSMSSKAFRVFNKRTKRVEENLHIEFLENKAIEKGAGPNWLFDIDSLTKSMNYVPVVDAGTNSTNFSGTKDGACQEVKKDVSTLRYIALPNWDHDAFLESSSSKSQDDCNIDVSESSGNLNPTATSTNSSADHMETLTVETLIPTISPPVPTACFTNTQEPSSETRLISKRVTNQEETPSWTTF